MRINRLVFLPVLIPAFLNFSISKIYSAEITSVGSSAVPVLRKIKETDPDHKLLKLKKFLKKQEAPLFDNAEDFVKEARKNNLPLYLVAGISGAESSFGKFIPFNSYNPFGWGVYGNNVIYFKSFKEAIAVVSFEIRKRYKDNLKPEQIGPSYAQSYIRWIVNVKSFTEQIENTPLEPEDLLDFSL